MPPKCACGHEASQHDELVGRCITCLCPEWHATMQWLSVMINGKYELRLPSHRAYRTEWSTGWERERIDSMHANLAPGDVIIDVGAEEGDMPALWESWDVRTILVEPNPLVWSNMKAIYDENGHRPFGWFVGFASDVTDLHPERCDVDATEQGDWPRCAYGPVITDHGFRHLSQQTDSTPQITLSDLAEGVMVDAITMDVEGAEWHALLGARRLLDRDHPLVWVSIHPTFLDEMYDRSLGDVVALMSEVGYQATHLATDHEEHWLFWHPDGRQPIEA